MKKNDNRATLRKMIERYLSGQASAHERAFLEKYFERFNTTDDVTDQLPEAALEELRTKMEGSILENISQAENTRTRMLPMIVKIAAAVLVFVSVGTYLYYSRLQDGATAQQDIAALPVQPGGNKAWLTLSTGKKISLDDARIGQVTEEGSSVADKTSDGQLRYRAGTGADPASAIAYNTLSTPRGGEYQVVLTDGTRVWLNADSQLTFPTAFRGASRTVELIGEAYFEVAKNPSMPFNVKSGGQVVEVLGTHFNVNAYPDEAMIKTTLLEGRVQVHRQGTGDSKVLVPGQQAVVKSGADIRVARVNTDDAVAWKNGLFVFSNDNLAGVMRKISRWYNVDIVYAEGVTQETFVGSVSKFENLTDVLAVLELTGMVHFQTEGRRVTVMP